MSGLQGVGLAARHGGCAVRARSGRQSSQAATPEHIAVGQAATLDSDFHMRRRSWAQQLSHGSRSVGLPGPRLARLAESASGFLVPDAIDTAHPAVSSGRKGLEVVSAAQLMRYQQAGDTMELVTVRTQWCQQGSGGRRDQEAATASSGRRRYAAQASSCRRFGNHTARQ